MSLYTPEHVRFVVATAARLNADVEFAEAPGQCDVDAINRCTADSNNGIGCLNIRSDSACCDGAREAIICLRPLYARCGKKVLNDALAKVELLYNSKCPDALEPQSPSEPTLECDSCSYEKDGKCVSVCPSDKSCIKRKYNSFCVACNCFTRSDENSRTQCCVLNRENTSCENAPAIEDSPCKNSDESLATTEGGTDVRGLKPASDNLICKYIVNFTRNKCACKIKTDAAGTKTCVFRK